MRRTAVAVTYDQHNDTDPVTPRENKSDGRVDAPPPAPATVATLLAPLLRRLFGGEPPVRFLFWDRSSLGPENRADAVQVRSSSVLRRLLWSPNELGLARAFIVGEVDLSGDLYGMLKALQGRVTWTRRSGPAALMSVMSAAVQLRAFGRPLPRPEEESHLPGWRHSKRRDAAAISHHYDVAEGFYRLVLGDSMTYSCAHFDREEMTLEEAQRSKHDLICRKLGLHERTRTRLLDVGCGWGSMAMHAAERYDADVVAVTLSESQAHAARVRVWDAGLERKIDVRVQDYRDLRGESFDVISSVGMFEHVGATQMAEYFETLSALLAPHGRLLNHAISTPGGSRRRGRTFINRYVFPDGELIDVADVVRAMERAGFEVRDAESLREHYSQTLHAWVANLEGSWNEAVKLVGEHRARTWRLYMAASANRFDDGGLAIHQVLGVKPGIDGTSGMPRTRAGWVTRSNQIDRSLQRVLQGSPDFHHSIQGVIAER
jgi:cyclopropane-fatty-acyl-phospholipid synthase